MLSNDTLNRLRYALTSQKAAAEVAGMFNTPYGVNPSGGHDFYVDGNTAIVSGDGSSWLTPFATLAAALAASDADIGGNGQRNWATRNRIFCVGDALVEDLTKLAQKTDVIGVGTCDGFGDKCRLQGNHVIAGTYYGCRFFNFAFLDNAATGTIMTLVAGQGAAQFIGCDWLTGTATVVGLKATGVTDLQVVGNRFLGSWTSSFSTAAISLLGPCHRANVEGNLIENTHATGVGMLVDAGFTANGPATLKDNVFETTAMALNDAAAAFSCLDNYFVVGTAKAINTSIVYAAAKAANNFVTGNDGSIKAPVTTP